MTNTPTTGTPTGDLDAVLAIVRRQASPLSATALTLLALVSGGGALLIATLWATEPVALPVRTRWAFALCILVASSWCAFAVHGLRRARRPYAGQRVVAAAMGTAFSALFTLFGLAVAWGQEPTARGWAVGATGATVTVCAALMWGRARRARVGLEALRRELRARRGAPLLEVEP